jgi:hypothetical protein
MSTPLNFVTIVLDGMPWITSHIQAFNRLKTPWHWYVIEGAASNTHCTYWCKPQSPRLSNDGTTQYLDGLVQHPRVTVIRQHIWDGKVSMCNSALAKIKEPCVLMQIDSDELWTTEQIEKIRWLIENQSVSLMNFYCNYFIGPNIVTTDNTGAWVRAWRFNPGMKFASHEPPNLVGTHGAPMDRNTTKAHGLVFDHMSYVTEASVAFKEQFYGYSGAVEQWKRFQKNTTWPVGRLKDHLSFAGAAATADLFVK